MTASWAAVWGLGRILCLSCMPAVPRQSRQALSASQCPCTRSFVREHEEGPAEVSQELFIPAYTHPTLGSEQAGVCHRSGEQEASALGKGQPM